MKKLLIGFASIALASCSLGSTASVGGLSYRGGELTAKSYACDGLVFQLDGIENAGHGLQESAPAVWKDLAGSQDVTLPSWVSYANKTFRSDVVRGATDGDKGKSKAPTFSSLSGIDNSTPVVTLEVTMKRGDWIYTDSYGNTQAPISMPRGYICYRQKDNNGFAFWFPISSTGQGLMEWRPSGILATETHALSATMGAGVNEVWCDGSFQLRLPTTGTYKWDSSYAMFKNKRAIVDVMAIRIYNRKLNDAELRAHQLLDRARFLGEALPTDLQFVADDISEQVWDGANDVRPAVTVRDYFANAVLVQGRDYYLDYRQVDRPGTGSVTVRGLGNYADMSVTKTFTIRRGFTAILSASASGALVANVSFPATTEARTLFMASGANDAGDGETNDWDAVTAVAEVPAGMSELADVALPSDVGAKARFFLAAKTGSESYVQSGLMQQLDGLDNALAGGARTHDATPTKWTDVTGNGNDVTLPDFVTVQDDAMLSAASTSKTDLPTYASLNGLSGSIDNLTYEATTKRVKWTYTDNYNNTQCACETPVGFLGYRGSGDRQFGCLMLNTVNSTAVGDYYTYEHETKKATEMNTLQARLSCDKNLLSVSGDNNMSWKQRWTDTTGINQQYVYFSNKRAEIKTASIRLYNRSLTSAELKRNAKVDAVRYRSEGVLWASSELLDASAVSKPKGKGNGTMSLLVPVSDFARLAYVAWGTVDGGTATSGWDHVARSGVVPVGVSRADGLVLPAEAQRAKAARIFLTDRCDSHRYVQSGLALQLDGEDNAVVDGVRQHDATSRIWADLTGNVAAGIPLPDWVTVEDRAVYSTAALENTNVAFDVKGISAGISVCTVEAVAQRVKWTLTDKYNTLQRVFAVPNGDFGYRNNETYGVYVLIPQDRNNIRMMLNADTSVSVGVQNSFSVQCGLFENGCWGNGTKMSLTLQDYKTENGTQCRMFGNTRADVRICSVRVYNRALTAEERAFNEETDAVRFRGREPAFEASALVNLKAAGMILFVH